MVVAELFLRYVTVSMVKYAVINRGAVGSSPTRDVKIIVYEYTNTNLKVELTSMHFRSRKRRNSSFRPVVFKLETTGGKP